MTEYIERDSVLATLLAWYNRATHPLNAGKYNDGEISAYSTAMSVVELAPAEDVAPVHHGRWIKDESSRIAYRCSVCDVLQHWSVIQDGRYKYCPNCGSRMDL